MKIVFAFLSVFFLCMTSCLQASVYRSRCKPIVTPEYDERNKFFIKSPSGWGYRTFNGENGLIGVLWPKGTSFSATDTAVFVFIQDSNVDLSHTIPENAYIFSEKCPQSVFKFSKNNEDQDKTLSIGEKYFSGRCGRTRIFFEERIQNYKLVIALVSSHYISAQLFQDVKYTVNAYKVEIEKALKLIQKSQKENDSP